LKIVVSGDGLIERISPMSTPLKAIAERRPSRAPRGDSDPGKHPHAEWARCF
jgi:hypothetical protein